MIKNKYYYLYENNEETPFLLPKTECFNLIVVLNNLKKIKILKIKIKFKRIYDKSNKYLDNNNQKNILQDNKIINLILVINY